MIKMMIRLVSLLASVLAGVIFKQVWKLAARQRDATKATDDRRGWHEILPAAALRGAVYAVTKAAVARGAAESTHKLTGVWPGENVEQGAT